MKKIRKGKGKRDTEGRVESKRKFSERLSAKQRKTLIFGLIFLAVSLSAEVQIGTSSEQKDQLNKKKKPKATNLLQGQPILRKNKFLVFLLLLPLPPHPHSAVNLSIYPSIYTYSVFTFISSSCFLT